MGDDPILPGGIDWEQIEQEDRLWPWLNDPSQEVMDEWSAYTGEE